MNTCLGDVDAGETVRLAEVQADRRTSRRLAELGFVVVQIDGMGTNWRSKAFHDVCWQNLVDGGFPDRIAWLKAAADAFGVSEATFEKVQAFKAGAGPGKKPFSAVVQNHQP